MNRPLLLPGILLLLFLGLPAIAPAQPAYNVRDSGAAGDGTTNDTAALQKAINLASVAGGGEVDFPAGTYLTGSIELKSHVTLNLASGATIHGINDPTAYPLTTNARWEGLDHECHQALIFAHDAEDIAITGSGSIIGEGEVGKLRNPRGPTLFEPTSCENVRITGVTVSNSGVWTLHPTYCHDVVISHVTIDSKGGNSDGIDPDSCQGMTIDHCSFSAGDDDIAIKSGKGQEGVKVGKPSEDITITNCTFTKGHGGVSFGSEVSGGIANVTVSHCTFSGVAEALNFKTAAGRAGYVRNVTADHLVVTGIPLLILRTDYHSNPDSQGVPGDAGNTTFSSISISDAQVTAKDAVRVIASPDKPLDGLSLTNITGSSAHGLVICNAINVVLKDIKLDGIKGPALYTENATGTGLDGPAPYTAPAKAQ